MDGGGGGGGDGGAEVVHNYNTIDTTTAAAAAAANHNGDDDVTNGRVQVRAPCSRPHAVRRPPSVSSSTLLGVGIQLFYEIVTCLLEFPRLEAVARAWQQALASPDAYIVALRNMDGCWRPSPLPADGRAWKQYWKMNIFHAAWRPSKATLMVDYANCAIDNLTNNEGTASQIYYTFPRVGLQFKRRFTLFALRACRDLMRIALKKGTHIRSDPCVENAEYLATGQAAERIIKLDFTTTPLVGDRGGKAAAATNGATGADDAPIDSPGPTETSVVVWTSAGVELFTFVNDPSTKPRLTQAELKMVNALQPQVSERRLGVPAKEVAAFLVLHINDAKVISILSAATERSPAGRLAFYDFESGAYRCGTEVPGPIRADTSSAHSDRGEWKSRERFDFKGSSSIGAVIDDEGTVHVYHFATGGWFSIVADFWHGWCGRDRHGAAASPDTQATPLAGRSGPRPKYLRTAGSFVAIWNGTSTEPPYYIEVWQVVPASETSTAAASDGTPLTGRRVLRECYTNVSSVHVDDTRCYINATLDNKDVYVDTWDLVTGSFVSRVHSVNNSWSFEKQQVRTHLSKLFWSAEDCAIYYELNTRQDSGSVLTFRQLTCVPQDEYWAVCKALKGDDMLKRETYPITTTHRPQRALQQVWSDVCVDESSTVTVTDFEEGRM